MLVRSARVQAPHDALPRRCSMRARLPASPLLAALACAATSGLTSAQGPCDCRPGPGRPWLWISPTEIARLPMDGPAWDARPAQNRGVHYYAQQSTDAPEIADQDDNTDVFVLAKALVYLRLKQEPFPLEDPEPYRAEVQAACLAARGTENGHGGNTLSLGRNLFGYVVAANLIDWDDSVQGAREADFRSWVANVRTERFQEGLITRTLVGAHEDRPNNWGLMCGASRLAADIYLCDQNGECQCWNVFRRWLGDASSPFDFAAADWGGPVPADLSWQHDQTALVGINPLGASKLDCMGVRRSLDGVMPDEMRRSGPFRELQSPPLGHAARAWLWPAYPEAPQRDYNWEALQAVVAQAILFERLGKDPWSISDRAIARAFQWQYRELRFPVTDPQAGDDAFWLPYIANRVYALELPEPATTKPGRQTGFGDWTTLDPSWP